MRIEQIISYGRYLWLQQRVRGQRRQSQHGRQLQQRSHQKGTPPQHRSTRSSGQTRGTGAVGRSTTTKYEPDSDALQIFGLCGLRPPQATSGSTSLSSLIMLVSRKLQLGPLDYLRALRVTACNRHAQTGLLGADAACREPSARSSALPRRRG